MTTAATKHNDRPNPAITPNVNIKTRSESVKELMTKPSVAKIEPAIETLRQPYLCNFFYYYLLLLFLQILVRK